MAKAPLPEADESAEKAYAAAAEAAPVEFPPSAKRGRKPKVAAPVAAPEEPVAIETVPAELEIAPKDVPSVDVAPDIAAIETAPEPAPVVEPEPELPAEPAVPVALEVPAALKAKPRPRIAAPKARPVKVAPKPVAAKPIASKPIAPKSVAARKPAPVPTAKPKAAQVEIPVISQLKDTTMASKTTDFISDAGTKVKAAFEKSTSSIGDVTEFAKGNVEAVVESGKIYAAGLKDLSSNYVTEGKSAFEAMTADVKELAAQKTPVDFFKLQSELAKKNFESAMAFGTKSSEAWLKLANETFAPLSGRVTLAVDKIKAAA